MSAIKAGDLVVVVGLPSCPHANEDDLGHVFQVRDVQLDGGGVCKWCRQQRHRQPQMYAADPTQECWYPFARLRRIPPLSELRYADRFEEEKV